MNKPERADESQDESLANVPPSPADPEAVTLTVAGAGAFLLIAASTSTCMGATRSTKLEWEKRQQEIQRAERAFAAAQTESDDSGEMRASGKAGEE